MGEVAAKLVEGAGSSTGIEPAATGMPASPMLELSEVLTRLLDWLDGQTPLRVLLSTPDGRFAFDCKLARFFDTGISFQLSGDADSIDLSLAGYDFEALDEGSGDAAREEISGHSTNGPVHGAVQGRGLKASGGGRTLVILERIEWAEG